MMNMTITRTNSQIANVDTEPATYSPSQLASA
jgi:hypothetical protein